MTHGIFIRDEIMYMQGVCYNFLPGPKKLCLEPDYLTSIFKKCAKINVKLM